MIDLTMPELCVSKTLTAETPRLPNPYRCLRPFTEEDEAIFFGREDELAQLLDWVQSLDTVTVLGETAIGKTSLLRAGLTPALVRLGYEVTYVDCFHSPALEVPYSLAETRSVMLLDRVEALFAAGREAQCKQWMLDLANSTSKVKLVISLRRDFAHRLLDLYTQVRSLGGHSQRVYLDALRREPAYQALVCPSERAAYPLAPEVAQACLDNLEAAGGYYPMDLQVLGYELYEWAVRHGRPMALADYYATGGAHVLIDQYFTALVDN